VGGGGEDLETKKREIEEEKPTRRVKFQGFFRTSLPIKPLRGESARFLSSRRKKRKQATQRDGIGALISDTGRRGGRGSRLRGKTSLLGAELKRKEGGSRKVGEEEVESNPVNYRKRPAEGTSSARRNCRRNKEELRVSNEETRGGWEGGSRAKTNASGMRFGKTSLGNP